MGKENDLEKVRKMKRETRRRKLFQKNDQEILNDEGKRDSDLSSHFRTFS